MLCVRLSSTLFLGATCLLMSAVVSTDRIITCDNFSDNVHRLSCDVTANGVIIVESALFGRLDKNFCSLGHGDILNRCSQEGTLEMLKNRCNGKRVCELNRADFQDYDPCVGIQKYLDITFSCLPALYMVICEHSVAFLHCDNGQVINVHGADYGRSDQTTCSYRRNPYELHNRYCSRRVTSEVRESCNAKKECTISVHSHMFGNPCPGTYKYLELAYTCEYPIYRDPIYEDTTQSTEQRIRTTRVPTGN